MQLVSQITFGVIGSTPTKTIQSVCGSDLLKEQLCLLCTKVITNKDFRRKLMISGGQKKTKACLNLACVAWQFKKQFACKRTQHYCLKLPGTQANLNLELIARMEMSSGEGLRLTNICAEIAQTKMNL